MNEYDKWRKKQEVENKLITCWDFYRALILLQSLFRYTRRVYATVILHSRISYITATDWYSAMASTDKKNYNYQPDDIMVDADEI